MFTPCIAVFLCTWQVTLEETYVPGQGSLCAFADGRVRAMFDDRTIVHMNAAHSHCKVTG